MAEVLLPFSKVILTEEGKEIAKKSSVFLLLYHSDRRSFADPSDSLCILFSAVSFVGVGGGLIR